MNKIIFLIMSCLMVQGCIDSGPETGKIFLSEQEPAISGRFEAPFGAMEFFSDGEVLIETSEGAYKGLYKMKGVRISIFDYQGNLIKNYEMREKGAKIYTMDGLVSFTRAAEIDQHTKVEFQGASGPLQYVPSDSFQSTVNSNPVKPTFSDKEIESSPLAYQLPEKSPEQLERELKIQKEENARLKK